MQGEGTLIPTYRNEHDRSGLRGASCRPMGAQLCLRQPRLASAATRPSCATVKYAGCHPKTSELCLCRMKSGETPMEVRSGSLVQIDRRTRA
jgi:hypothetical protein